LYNYSLSSLQNVPAFGARLELAGFGSISITTAVLAIFLSVAQVTLLPLIYHTVPTQRLMLVEGCNNSMVLVLMIITKPHTITTPAATTTRMI
jgi:hypothetical protein